jgi:hypothetical protein
MQDECTCAAVVASRGSVVHDRMGVGNVRLGAGACCCDCCLIKQLLCAWQAVEKGLVLIYASVHQPGGVVHVRCFWDSGALQAWLCNLPVLHPLSAAGIGSLRAGSTHLY